MSENWNPIGLPRPERLPEALQPIVAEYYNLTGQMQQASRERGQLLGQVDAAKHADAAQLGRVAREGGDIHAVGTPAQDKLSAQIRAAETKVRGLTQARQEVEIEVRQAFREHAEAGIENAYAEAERALKPYMKAIAAIEEAAAAYDAAIQHLGGWETYVASNGQRIAWAEGHHGTIIVRGQVLEPVKYGQMTAALREHARRHKKILDAIEKNRAEQTTAPGDMPRRRTDELAATGAAVWDAA